MNESPEERRERMRREELNKPFSSVHGSVLSDLVGSLSWKGTLIIIIVIVILFVTLRIF